MTRPWLIDRLATPWRLTISFVARCPGCGRDAVWRGHVRAGQSATDTVYDAIDCAVCDHDWTARAQAARRTARLAQAEDQAARQETAA